MNNFEISTAKFLRTQATELERMFATLKSVLPVEVFEDVKTTTQLWRDFAVEYKKPFPRLKKYADKAIELRRKFEAQMLDAGLRNPRLAWFCYQMEDRTRVLCHYARVKCDDTIALPDGVFEIIHGTEDITGIGEYKDTNKTEAQS